MKKKLMILGASILQLPAIIESKNMGIETIVVDYDKNAIGFKESDVCIEISTIDIPEVIKVAKQYKIDGIMTLASDMPMRTVAAVAQELNIIGVSVDTALKATDKTLMRECFDKDGVPIPKFYRVTEYEEYNDIVRKFSNKFIVKPADNSGSRGIYLVKNIKNKNDIDYAFEYSKKYSRNGKLLVEEYMEGPEVSVEALSYKGVDHIIAITDKLTTGSPRFVEMGHSQPTKIDIDMQTKIKEVTMMAIKAVGIENGPSHTEIIVTNEGPKVVEIGARLGGDNITTNLVPLSTGLNMVRASIDIALGNKPKLDVEFNKGSAIRYFNIKPGIIKSIENLEAAKKISGVKQITLTKGIGDSVSDIYCSNDRIGYVIAQDDTLNGAIEICNSVKNTIKINGCNII